MCVAYGDNPTSPTDRSRLTHNRPPPPKNTNSLAILFEIAAFLLLRLERPNLPRPYRMPVNTLGACLVMLLPLAFIFLILATASARTWLVSGGLALLGVLSHWGMEALKAHGICDFYVAPPAPVPLVDLDLRAGGGGGGREEEGPQHHPHQLSLRIDGDEEKEAGVAAASVVAAGAGARAQLRGDEEAAAAYLDNESGTDDDGDDDGNDQASLCPQPLHPGPQRPAAVTLAERVARSLSPGGW